ncbi:MAG TPA: SpoIIE family protein phosphatase [Actinomycetota bacterium]|nr:SpoIIE family protein phosphatase [Actinomycetota bacterium]
MTRPEERGLEPPVGRWVRAARWLSSHVWATVAIGVLLEALVTATFRYLDRNAWAGVPGTLGSVIAILVALLCGAWAASAVALSGGLLFVVILANNHPPQPTLNGFPVVALWVAIALITGAVSDREKRKTSDALGAAVEARNEALRAKADAEATARQTQRLQRVTAELSRAISPGEVAGAVIEHGLPSLGATSGAMLLLSEDGSQLEIVRGQGYTEREGQRWRRIAIASEVPIAEAVREGEPVFVRDGAEMARRYPGIAAASPTRGDRASACVPLVVSGVPVGGLALSFDGPRAFTREERDPILTLASRAAEALERARRYEAERGVAEILQRSLLPDRLPETPGITAAARYVAAGPHTEVGGDWYDLMTMPHGQVGVVIGDVAGRGTRAAAVMGHFRTALRAYSLEHVDPAEALDRLSRHLDVYDERDMATVLLVVLEPDSGHLAYASAGHPPALLKDPSGAARFLEGGLSTPLGAVDASGYAPAEGLLPEGGTLLLYTDGLVERRGEPLDLGLGRLRRAMEDGPDDPEELCDHLIRTMIRADGHEDDVALIAIRREPMAARYTRTFPARPQVLSDLRRSLTQWLWRVGAGEDETFDVILAASEASTNTIEHAYGAADGAFELEAEVESGDVVVRVRDGGRWRAPRGEHRGRGITMMRALMDKVDIRHEESGTEVVMRRRLRASS